MSIKRFCKWGVILSDEKTQQKYLGILKRQLVPALGCTEPISIAYAAAKCRSILGCEPKKIVVKCSGNIIKNVKSVIVPNTETQRGVDVAAVLGAIAGDYSLGMEVLSKISREDVCRANALVEKKICCVKLFDSSENLHFIIEMRAGDQTALVEVSNSHLNVIREVKNGEIIFKKSGAVCGSEDEAEKSMTVTEIYRFAKEVPTKELDPILRPQMECNLKVADMGLSSDCGAAVGRILLQAETVGPREKAIAYAAAGSDARMSGCALPVVINSGSGNQGMTVSLPVIVYAEEIKAREEDMFRALAFSNLLAVYQKAFIGKLSAYCGVVSAATGALAGIAFLNGESLDIINGTITNSLGNIAGMVCDGAKESCAAKVASALQTAFLSYDMARNGYIFQPGDGLIKHSVDDTIRAVGRMGREGMYATDKEILNIMLE